MKISDFVDRHSSDTILPSQLLLKKWEQEAQLDQMLAAQIGNGIILGDILIGDGLIDQVSSDLLDAFSKLMGNKANTYDEVREHLLNKLESGDKSVLGLINKIKGQVGENFFKKELDQVGSARLATLGNQEGWDIAVDTEAGTQYIQVKMYSDSNGVIRHMKAVNEKLSNSELTILDGDSEVSKIDFAVPENIYDEVTRKAEEAGLEFNILPIKMSAVDAAAVVSDGFDNVGLSSTALENFFGEILGVAGNSVILHGATSAFLAYKGSKLWDDAVYDTAENVSITLASAMVAGTVDLFLKKALVTSGPTGVLVFGTAICSRAILKRISQRTDYVHFIMDEVKATKDLIAQMKNDRFSTT
jgi:hypothetical protein